jgi:RHS repeat-associated protein
VVWSADYEAFGSVLSERGDSSFTPSYTGKFFDKASGLYYFNARWYDSDLGRFSTYDLLRDGINWKNYCNGNPLVRIDKTGNYWEYIEEGNAIVQVWIEESAATGLTKAGVSSVTKLRGLGLIAAFCLSLQGSQIHPALPPNFTWENNNIIAPDGTSRLLMLLGTILRGIQNGLKQMFYIMG